MGAKDETRSRAVRGAGVISTDILVIGGGTAGFGAAVAAARMGYGVRLVEAGTGIGGVMASCPGMPWGAAYPAGHSIGGVFAELAGRLMEMDPPAAEKRPCTLENFGPEIVYDPDMAAVMMHEMLAEAGVALHPGTLALAPVMNRRRIEAVEIADRAGRGRIEAGMVIDCSGDGDISVKAGVPFEKGGAGGEMMAVTLTFRMEGADWARVFAGNDPYFRQDAARGIAAGRLHPDLARLYMMKGLHPGTVFCNSVVIREVDGTDPAAVARATQEGRRRCLALAAFLRDEVAGFAQARMAGLGPAVGVRETRRLEGRIRVTGTDLARATKFADGIVACDNPVDDVMRGSGAMTHEAIVGEGAYYTIPLGALIPRKIENLLFAGRLISADPVAFASVRGMPQCMGMGQAAGVAAALALARRVTVQDLDAGAVVAVLKAEGVRGLGGDPLSPP